MRGDNDDEAGRARRDRAGDPPPFGASAQGTVPNRALLQAVEVEKALALMGGDLGIYRLVMGSIVERGLAGFGEFEAAAAAGRSGDCERIAHGMKGLGATIGATEIRDLAEALEDGFRQGLPPPPGALLELKTAYLRLLDLAGTWLGSLPPNEGPSRGGPAPTDSEGRGGCP